MLCDTLGTENKWKNLNGKQFHDFILSDIFYKNVKTYIKKGDCVIHMGANSSTVEQDMDSLLQTNYECSKLIFNTCVMNEARMIYASSASVYGNGDNGFSDKNTKIYYPINKYAFSKSMFDMWQIQQKNRPPQCVGLRFFNVYGPNEYHKGFMSSVVYQFYNQIIGTNTVKLFKSYKHGYKDGEQLRDFIYIKDVTKIIDFFVKNEGFSGIYNVGTGKARSYNELAACIFKSLNKPNSISYVEMPESIRNSYQYYTQADMSKLSSIRSNNGMYSLEDGVHDYVTNYFVNQKYYW